MDDQISKPGPLTAEQLAEFKRDGFVVQRGAFGDADIALVDRWMREMAARPEQIGKHWVFHEPSLDDPDADLISRMEYISPFHDGFTALVEALAAPAGQLLGEAAVLFKEKINFKMAGGDGFKPHQDSQAGWEDYAPYFITVMLCVDAATEENGCLRVVAGHQSDGLARSWEPLTDADMDGMEFKPCPTAPGDLVIFDSYTPHESLPNHTSKMRRLYFATYNRLSDGDHLAQYYADKRKNYPPDIERESDREYIFRV